MTIQAVMVLYKQKEVNMEESQILDIWTLFKDYLDKKSITLVCERYIDMLIDYGVTDQQLKELLGNDDMLDKAIEYYLDECDDCEDE